MTLLKKTRAALTAAAVAAVLAACTAEAATTSATGTTLSAAAAEEASASAGSTVTDALAANLTTHDAESDYTYDESEVVEVALTGDSAETDSDAVSVDGGTVTITAAGTYRLSGSLAGQVVVDTEDDGIVRLILDDAEISSSTTSALAILDAEKAMVVLADGSANSLSDGSDYGTDGEEPNAALYSAADLTITGTGALAVEGNANDGIASQDGLILDSGTLTVTAADDGIRGKDYLVVDDADVTVTAAGDGLKSDNADDVTAGYVYLAGGTVRVSAGGDGVAAESDVIVGGGTVAVVSGGGSGASVAEDASAKGLKGAISVVIGGGTIDVDAADDAVHSDGVVSITDGTVTLASADDGVHAETDLTVAGGTLTLDAYEGLESAVITISGGDLALTTADDGINVAGGDSTAADGMPGGGAMEASDAYQLTITGGSTVIDAEGDGLDSNGYATMTGGTVVVNGPTGDGNGAIDVNGTFDVSGGTLVAAGSAGMAVAPDTASAQGWVSATFDSVQPAGSSVEILAGDGTVVGTYTAEKDFSSLIYSSAGVETGAEYQVVVDGAATTVTAGEHTGGMGGGMGGGRGGGFGGPPN
jgi:hypothetical protein